MLTSFFIVALFYLSILSLFPCYFSIAIIIANVGDDGYDDDHHYHHFVNVLLEEKS